VTTASDPPLFHAVQQLPMPMPRGGRRTTATGIRWTPGYRLPGSSSASSCSSRTRCPRHHLPPPRVAEPPGRRRWLSAGPAARPPRRRRRGRARTRELPVPWRPACLASCRGSLQDGGGLLLPDECWCVPLIGERKTAGEGLNRMRRARWCCACGESKEGSPEVANRGGRRRGRRGWWRQWRRGARVSGEGNRRKD
jgi:hypothetical protein